MGYWSKHKIKIHLLLFLISRLLKEQGKYLWLVMCSSQLCHHLSTHCNVDWNVQQQHRISWSTLLLIIETSYSHSYEAERCSLRFGHIRRTPPIYPSQSSACNKHLTGAMATRKQIALSKSIQYIQESQLFLFYRLETFSACWFWLLNILVSGSLYWYDVCV